MKNENRLQKARRLKKENLVNMQYFASLPKTFENEYCRVSCYFRNILFERYLKYIENENLLF